MTFKNLYTKLLWQKRFRCFVKKSIYLNIEFFLILNIVHFVEHKYTNIKTINDSFKFNILPIFPSLSIFPSLPICWHNIFLIKIIAAYKYFIIKTKLQKKNNLTLRLLKRWKNRNYVKIRCNQLIKQKNENQLHQFFLKWKKNKHRNSNFN